MVFLFSLIYLVVIYKCVKGQYWWYDTILCYPFGMYVSLYKERFIALFQNRFKTLCLLGGGIAFYLIGKNLLLKYHLLNKTSIWTFHNVFYVFAVLLIVFITTSFYIKNNILEWFGSNLFSFYIL